MSSSTSKEDWPLPELTRARRAIVVVDVVESVRLMQEDETGFIERWRRFVHEARTEVLPRHGGRMVKSLGDGMLLEFRGASSAVAAALEMQRRAASGFDGPANSVALGLRCGVHECDVVVDDIDVYGTGVNMAARIATLAGPGEVIASADVRDALVAGVDADVEDLGPCYVKHLTEPVRAFRIGPARSGVAFGHTRQRPWAPLQWYPALAVIPLHGDEAGAAGGVLGDMLADEVIAALSKAPHLHVISRLSTRAFGGRRMPVGELGRHLGAAYVVSGTHRTLGEKVIIQMELCDVASARVVWADRLESKVRRLFSGDSELIGRIAAELSRAVLCEEVSRAGRRAMPTHESYTLLMAAVHLMHRNARQDFEYSRSMLEHLIDRNPDEPLPRAWMGKWYAVRAAQGWGTNPLDDARQALGHVERALSSDPANSLAWAIKGLILSYINKDLSSARMAYDAALAANPNESLAWLYSATLSAWQDAGSEAVAAARMAQRLSPLDPLKYYYDSLSATALLVAGDLDTSIQLARQSMRHNRAHVSTHRTLAIAQALADRMPEAQASVRELLRLDPEFTVSVFRTRYPGRDSAHAARFCQALAEAGVPL